MRVGLKRGTCPVCGVRHALGRRGRLCEHQSHKAGRWCSGSGAFAVEVVRDLAKARAAAEVLAHAEADHG